MVNNFGAVINLPEVKPNTLTLLPDVEFLQVDGKFERGEREVSRSDCVVLSFPTAARGSCMTEVPREFRVVKLSSRFRNKALTCWLVGALRGNAFTASPPTPTFPPQGLIAAYVS